MWYDASLTFFNKIRSLKDTTNINTHKSAKTSANYSSSTNFTLQNINPYSTDLKKKYKELMKNKLNEKNTQRLKLSHLEKSNKNKNLKYIEDDIEKLLLTNSIMENSFSESEMIV